MTSVSCDTDTHARIHTHTHVIAVRASIILLISLAATKRIKSCTLYINVLHRERTAATRALKIAAALFRYDPEITRPTNNSGPHTSRVHAGDSVSVGQIDKFACAFGDATNNTGL